MALYHFSVRNVSRGKGQMVVASAAYISGQRIFDSYYNKIHDYTSKVRCDIYRNPDTGVCARASD